MTTERTKGFCIVCKPKEPKAIYKYLNGDKNAPLCGACNMRLWRESTSNEQAKRLTQMTALIGGVEAALKFNLEEHEREFLISTQDGFKRLLRYWAGDESANLKKDAHSVDWAEAVKPEHDDELAATNAQAESDEQVENDATWVVPGKRVRSEAFGSVTVVKVDGDVATVRGDDGAEHQIKSYALEQAEPSQANNPRRKPGRPRKQPTSEPLKVETVTGAMAQ